MCERTCQEIINIEVSVLYEDSSPRVAVQGTLCNFLFVIFAIFNFKYANKHCFMRRFQFLPPDFPVYTLLHAFSGKTHQMFQPSIKVIFNCQNPNLTSTQRLGLT